MGLFSHQKAFCLSEVLIVLGGIGIIANLLLPNLIDSYKQKVSTTALKRALAVFSEAYNLAVVDNGTPDNWNLGASGDQTGLNNINDILSKYIKTTKNCGSDSGCFPNTYYKNLNGNANSNVLNQDSNYTKFILASGESVSIKQLDANCNLTWGASSQLKNVCGVIGIDVNGFKAPNQYGEDYFGFALTKYGIVPMGTALQSDGYSFNKACNKSNSNDAENGLGCSAWLIYNENMDYQENSYLAWNNVDTVSKNNGNNGNNNTNGNNNNGMVDNNSGNNNTNGNNNPVGSNYNDHTNSGNNLTNGNSNGNHTTNGNNNKK